MAKSFIRNFADQITGNTVKTTDTDIIQAVTQFHDEQAKLTKFKREFEKYTQAIIVYDNASHRFFDFVRSLPNSFWQQQRVLDALFLDMTRVRNEHLQNLNKQIHSDINSLLDKFHKMKTRIDEQEHVQSDYDKVRKQYNSSVRRDEQAKVDRIKTELDELKSTLNLVNKGLRDDLTKLFPDIHGNYLKTIVELTDSHGNFHQNTYQLCSGFVSRFQGSNLLNLERSRSNTNDELQSSTESLTKKTSPSISSSQQKKKNYKFLHQARVIHNYEAENDDELNLIKDELISVISFENEEDNERDQGWEYAEKEDGTVGLFPVNFAVRLYDNEVQF